MFHFTLQHIQSGKISQFITPLLCFEYIICEFLVQYVNLKLFFVCILSHHCRHPARLTIASEVSASDLIPVECELVVSMSRLNALFFLVLSHL